ncbi:MAG: chemotaxis-specific protein-glutamate methyltransferase CheB [Polyangiaceae bacterium]
MSFSPLRLLIVDDSAYNRNLIEQLFRGRDDVVVVGTAADGEEAIRLASQLEPDVITLDLEMPKMDGFTCLRILLARRPVSVIVVSSYAQRENVFKALDIGAVDFVTKATSTIDANAEDLKAQIREKVLMVRSMRRESIVPPPRSSKMSIPEDIRSSRTLPSADPEEPFTEPRSVVAIASSTGGPGALMQIVTKLPKASPHAFLIAQHMPEKFTRTFAERLDKRGTVRTREAWHDAHASAGRAFVCPGGHCMSLSRVQNELRLRVVRPDATDRYVPSGDRLFESVAMTMGARTVAVVLTGMGDDALLGSRTVRELGGRVIAEAESSAAVFGMPGAVIQAGLATEVLSLAEIASALAAL